MAAQLLLKLAAMKGSSDDTGGIPPPSFCKMVVAVAVDAPATETAAAAELAALAGQVCKSPPLAITTPAAAKATAQLAGVQPPALPSAPQH